MNHVHFSRWQKKNNYRSARLYNWFYISIYSCIYFSNSSRIIQLIKYKMTHLSLSNQINKLHSKNRLKICQLCPLYNFDQALYFEKDLLIQRESDLYVPKYLPSLDLYGQAWWNLQVCGLLCSSLIIDSLLTSPNHSRLMQDSSTNGSMLKTNISKHSHKWSSHLLGRHNLISWQYG